jgi:amino acid efflux transporter
MNKNENIQTKSINLYQAIALYIAAILGSGVLFLSGSTAAVAGPASILSWIILILLSLPLAYAFASLSRSYPDAGGAATFVRKAFGPHMGNLVGWFYFLTASVGQIIVSLTGAFYVSVTFDLSALSTGVMALIILLIGGVSNYFGLRISGKLSLVLSSCLLLLLLVTIISSLPRVTWDHFIPFTPHGWIPVGTAITMIFWAFFGWEAICNLSDRFKSPEKDIVRSTVISAIIIGTVFLALSFITIGTGTYGNQESNLSPVGVMMYQSFGVGAQVATAIIAFIISVGTVNAFVASLAQLGYALSRDGAFPKWFYFLHPDTETPTRIVMLVILFASIGVLATVALSIPFSAILFIPNSLGIMVYILSMAAGVRLFEKGTLPRRAAAVSLVMCLLCLPFFGKYVLIPIVMGAMYFLFHLYKNNKQGIRFGK